MSKEIALTFESPQIEAYGGFVAALAQAASTLATPFVSSNFRASFNPSKVNTLTGLDYQGFLEEVERQRVAFPDLGRDVDMIEVVEEGNTLSVTYDMTVTFIGPLTDAKGGYLPPTGNTVVIRATDTATFTPEGLIETFVVESDMADVIAQMSS